MGDRAIVVFKDTQEDGTIKFSPCIYLHWHGERVPEFLNLTKKLMESRGKDLQYTAARFIGICHENIPGNLSLGIWDMDCENKTPKGFADYSHGDAGFIVVDAETYQFKQYGEYYKLEEISEITS